MRRLVYDVAMTLDGFICRADGGIDGFIAEGDHVDGFVQRMAGYDTVVMGKATYEFGYRYGLVPGKRAYAHMQHFIFSRTLSLPAGSEVKVVADEAGAFVRALKQGQGSDIYLCGGGAFAGALLEQGLIDQLIVKLHPVIFGEGVRLFGDCKKLIPLVLVEGRMYASGVTLLRYDLTAAAQP